MTKTGFVKGMTIGVVTGAALGMVIAPKGKNSKSAAGKALKAAGEVIDNITGMWSSQERAKRSGQSGIGAKKLCHLRWRSFFNAEPNRCRANKNK